MPLLISLIPHLPLRASKPPLPPLPTAAPRFEKCIGEWKDKLMGCGFQELVFEDAMELLLEQVRARGAPCAVVRARSTLYLQSAAATQPRSPS